MDIAITGATGFIGRAVTTRLQRDGQTVRSVSMRTTPQPELFKHCDAVIHVAGEPVAQRWTTAARERIRASRVDGTRSLVAALGGLAKPPRVLISASAVGYYGSRGDEILTESSAPADDFLGKLAVEWEREAKQAEKLGIRVVILRIGVVLGRDGGALERMLVPFRLGVGGKIGAGNQWMSWIHLDDLAELVSFALTTPELRGAVNATAPNPVTNIDFTHELAHAVHRPAIFPVPRLALNLLYGEMASVIYASQRVVPEAACRAGFQFRYSSIRTALNEILG
ncbi:MAG: TIGR01777 family oxidoreductase [Bryobacteraceae bacterium]|jgi:uncharacterized protein (TIGR01777 family)